MKIAPIARVLLFVLICGCQSEPFQRAPLPVLHNPDPAAIRENFARSIPARFTSDDTVIIHAPFHDDLAVLAVLKVDRSAGTFELLALNHLGVQLFDLAGNRQGTTINFAIPPLMNQKRVLLAIGQDIRRIYFDLSPVTDAKVDVQKTLVRFTAGKLVYEFGGDPAALLEKRQSGWFGSDWRVRYYNYAASKAGLYPGGIVMDNGAYHYRIVIKNRDWAVE